MISAKDIFTVEREMMEELKSLAYRANLSKEEMDAVFDGLEGITERGFEELQNNLLSRTTNPLIRIRNGETLKASEIKQAVKKAANNDD